MGSSISVIPRLVTLRDKALRFFQANYRCLPELRGDKQLPLIDPTTDQQTGTSWCDTASPLIRGPLSYDHSINCIGFNYSHTVWTHEYVWTLCTWLALRVGKRIKGAPYVRYDGREIVKLKLDDLDEHGWFNADWMSQRSTFTRISYWRVGRVICPELHRLSKLWEVFE